MKVVHKQMEWQIHGFSVSAFSCVNGNICTECVHVLTTVKVL